MKFGALVRVKNSPHEYYVIIGALREHSHIAVIATEEYIGMSMNRDHLIEVGDGFLEAAKRWRFRYLHAHPKALRPILLDLHEQTKNIYGDYLSLGHH